MALSSLRSHFFKHLSCTTPTFFSARQVRHHLTPWTYLPAHLSPLCSPFTGTGYQWVSKLSTAAFPDLPAASSFTVPYLTAHIQCPRDVADMLSEALLCFGASSTSMDGTEHDERDDEVCISSTFFDCQDVDDCITCAAKSIDLKERPLYKVIKGDQCDWIKKSQESFQPVEITGGLWIVPEWRSPIDLEATNIILNPGLAFGTGEHPSTKLCLLLLHGIIKGGELFLDYGTGSGILAIAAIKFGVAVSVGVDVDPQAITSAQQNASLNNIGAEKLKLHLISSNISCSRTDEALCGSVETQNCSGSGSAVISKSKYDVVIANILLNPLLDLADQIVSYAKPGAVVGVSGIISEQIPYVIERYSEFLEGISVSKMDEWGCISGTKKRDLTAS